MKQQIIAGAFAAILCAAAPAAFAATDAPEAPPQAAQPDAKPLGTFGNWEAAFFMDGANKVCYMATKPKSTASASPIKGRDPAFLFITHWPADNEKNAVTITSGFTLKPGSKATVAVDGKVFTLETGGKSKADMEADAQMAWVQDQHKEDELATAISKGTQLTVKGTSKRGNVITDTYSLDGSGDAYKAISKECGY